MGRHAARASGLLRFGAVLALLVGLIGGGLVLVVILTSNGEDAPTPRPALQRGSSPPAGGTPSPTTKSPAGSPSPAGTGPMSPMAPTVELRLVGTSWVEVRGTSGRVLVSQICRKGDHSTFRQRQVTVTVGNAGAVRMRANGMPVELGGPGEVRVVTVMRGGD
jgi:hypothetical protein